MYDIVKKKKIVISKIHMISQHFASRLEGRWTTPNL